VTLGPFLIILAIDLLAPVRPLGEEVAVNAEASTLGAAPLGIAFTLTNIVGIDDAPLSRGAPLVTELALRDSNASVASTAQVVATSAGTSSGFSPDLTSFTRWSLALS